MYVISLNELITLGITPQDISRLLGTTETKKSKKVYFIYDLSWGRYQGVFSSKEKALEGVKQYLGDEVELMYKHAFGGGWDKDVSYVIEYRLPNGGFGYMYIDVWELDKVDTEPPHTTRR